MTGYQAFNMKDVLQIIRERKKEEIESIELEKDEIIEEYELETKKKSSLISAISPTI